MTISAFAILVFFSTILGGFLAFRFKDKLHLILGISAGAVLAISFFELIPEAFELAGQRFDTGEISLALALGFFFLMLIDRAFGHHKSSSEECEHHGHHHKSFIGAGSLSLHSFIDGLATGFAFQVSPELGASVAFAVLVHDFSDGLNTVNLVLRAGGGKMKVLFWLLLDAVAPILGIIASLYLAVSESVLGIIMAVFAGFFLYIGASDLLPESHHSHPTRWTTFSTILGAAVIFVVIQLLHSH